MRSVSRPLSSLLPLLVLVLLIITPLVVAHDACICPPGQQGSNSCTAQDSQCGPCAVTAYKNFTGGGTCTPCPAGYDSRATGGVSCTQCTAGEYYSGSAGCVTCGPGSANPTPGSSQCPGCLPGYYQPDSGQSYCMKCPAGTHIGSTRASTCYQCNANEVAPPGSAQCTACPSDQQPNSDASACVPKPTGASTKRRAVQQQLKAASRACAAGWTNCPVPARRGGGAALLAAWECVNTAEDVESCGGCVAGLDLVAALDLPVGAIGTDCTLFDPLADARCVKGRCEYTCPRGYNLTEAGCLKLQRPKRTNRARLTGRLDRAL